MLRGKIVERSGEFGWADGGGSKFAHHHTGGGVGQKCSIGQECACSDGEGEHAENGVSGSRNIENLTSGGTTINTGLADARVSYFETGGGNVQMAGRAFFENAHSLLTASDDDSSAAEMRQQRAPGFFHRLLGVQGTGHVETGLFFVAYNHSGAVVSEKARSFGLNKYGDPEPAAGVQNTSGKGIGEQTFVVIGEHERVQGFEGGEEQAEKLFFGMRREGIPALMVDANKLLLTRNDPGFYRSHTMGVRKDAAVVDSAITEADPELRARLVVYDFFGSNFFSTEHAECLDPSTKRSEIRGDIARASETIRLRDKVDDRHGRLR